MDANQPSLFDRPPAPPLDPIRPVGHVPAETIEERFARFHEANPHVARALARLALQLKRRGRQHFGMKALFEVLRFDYALQTTGDEFKLNNNYTAAYSRLLMREIPELAGFFEIRERRT